MITLEKEKFIDDVTDIIIEGYNENVHATDLALKIWMYLISIKIEIKEFKDEG